MRNFIPDKPTRDQLASIGPIEGKPPVLAARHRVLVLRNTWEQIGVSWEQWAEQLAEVEKDRTWEKYPDEQSPCGSLEALLEMLSINPEQALHRGKFETRQMATQANAVAAKPLGPVGRPKNPGDYQDIGSDGTTAAYLTARIARDRPDILERMKAGEYSSARAAAIDAGIISPKQRYSLPDDPEKAGRYLAERVDAGWLAAMLKAYEDAT